MIKEFRFQNWKSFGESVLYIDPLTFVIGTNASGKSNILDAISFLSDSAKGIPINDIAKQARGGLDWIVRKGAEAFSLSVTIDVDGDELTYTISCRKNDTTLQTVSESLTLKASRSDRTLFSTD